MAEYLAKSYLGVHKSFAVSECQKSLNLENHTWPSFSNKGFVMDTTMLSERWHRTIKEDILHRNANSRLIHFVDMLIKGSEGRSNPTGIMIDRRRLARSSYRALETNKRHRKAVAYYAKRPQKIRFIGNFTWELESFKPGELCTVKWKNSCTCNLTGSCKNISSCLRTEHTLFRSNHTAFSAVYGTHSWE
ncbi:hypothetical protein COOONC_24886 [Cooperia oncophora]